MGYFLVFRRYAPFVTFGFGFEGDHRIGPSVSMQATARTIGVVPFQRGSVGLISATTSGTHYDGAGAWVRKLAGNPKSNVSSSISDKVIAKIPYHFPRALPAQIL